MAELFSLGPPLKYLKPVDIEPTKRSTRTISGIAKYASLLNNPDPEYVPTETAMQKQARLKREKIEKQLASKNKRISEWDPSTDPKVRGDPYKTLFVGRLSYDATEQDLSVAFTKFGSIERVSVVRDNKTMKSKGYGFIVFEHERDLKGLSIK